MKKIAKNRYTKYLEEANGNRRLFSHRMDQLMRNGRDKISFDFYKGEDIRKNVMPKADAKSESLKAYLRDTFRPMSKTYQFAKDDRKKILQNTGLTEKAKEARGSIDRYKKLIKWDREPLKENTVGNPEKYVKIVHGGTKSTIHSFLRGGNSGYKLEAAGFDPIKKRQVKQGLQVHSKIGERAKTYAERAAQNKYSEPAVMTGYIKRKYLTHNQGDEYGVGSNFFDKIKGAKVMRPEMFSESAYNKMKVPSIKKLKLKQGNVGSIIMNKKASDILDDMYKKAKMEVPTEEEKKDMNIPEEYIDVAVGDQGKREKKMSRDEAKKMLKILGFQRRIENDINGIFKDKKKVQD